MKAHALAALGLLACSTPTPHLTGRLACSDRLHEIHAENWRPERKPVEDSSELAFTKPSEGATYHRALHCAAGLVLVDAEWITFNTEEEAKHHYDRRLAELTDTCKTETVDSAGFPEQPRTPTPQSSTTYFASAVSYIAMAGCLEPGEKRIVSLSRSNSHAVASEPETYWTVEYNRQPAP